MTARPICPTCGKPIANDDDNDAPHDDRACDKERCEPCRTLCWIRFTCYAHEGMEVEP